MKLICFLIISLSPAILTVAMYPALPKLPQILIFPIVTFLISALAAMIPRFGENQNPGRLYWLFLYSVASVSAIISLSVLFSVL